MVTLNDAAPEEMLRVGGAQINDKRKRRKSDWMRKIGSDSNGEKSWMVTADGGSLWVRQMPNGSRNVTHDGLSDHQLNGQNGLDWRPDGRTARRAVWQIDECVGLFLESECPRSDRKIRSDNQTHETREEAPKKFHEKNQGATDEGRNSSSAGPRKRRVWHLTAKEKLATIIRK